MKLHTDAPDAVGAAIREAVDRLPGVALAFMTRKGSRSRAGAVEFVLLGQYGREGGAYGTLSGRSAGWDEYGAVLAAAFHADPNARTGNTVGGAGYDGAEAFEWATGARFPLVPAGAAELPDDTHARHAWDVTDVVTGTYTVAACSRCSASRRWLHSGMTWAEWTA